MIPEALQARKQWVCWRYEQRGEKTTKVPYVADGSGRKASSTNAATWTTFSNAQAALGPHSFDGIGYVFSIDDPYTGIDLDHCITRDQFGNRVIDDWAQSIVDQMDSYTEWSPSGTGLHIFIEASMVGQDRSRRAYETGGIEIYDQGRYFTVTSDTFLDRPIEQRQTELNILLADLFPKNVVSITQPRQRDFDMNRGTGSAPELLSDDALIDRAHQAGNGAKFARLWKGDTSDYAGGDRGDGHSEADYALVGLLAFWTNNDTDRIDRLFRRSGLMRPKWDEVHFRGGITYGQQSISRIVQGAKSGYGSWRVPSDPQTMATNLTLASEIPQFPLWTLPVEALRLVASGSDTLPCSPEYLAVPILALAGAAVGPARELRVSSTWYEGPNLYAVVVGDAGSKKSPALKLASGPYVSQQNKLLEDHREAMNTYLGKLEIWEQDKKNPARPDKPKEPKQPDIHTTNTTVEQLAEMLSQKRGVAYILDELAAWVTSLNQYKNGKGSDRQFYLSAWARAVYKGDRKGSGTTFVQKPALTIVGGIQPDVFPELAAASTHDDGFLDRLLWAWPDEVADAYTRREVPEDILEDLTVLFEKLFAMGAEDPKIVVLGRDADNLFAEWHDGHIAQKASAEFPPRLKGPWAKMPSQALRLALILHCCETEPHQLVISAETMGRALDLADFFRGMAARVYKALDRRGDTVKWKLLRALKDASPEEVAQSYISSNVLKNNVEARVYLAALNELKADGFVDSRENDQQSTGRKTMYWRAL